MGELQSVSGMVPSFTHFCTSSYYRKCCRNEENR